ncbi:hypothetical protein [Jiangella mangrovi]|uniref:ATP/maltotriose-dependent transcriptional regulator MalT n=1 Tax=Jiangella mangrovi TaxID=1524084 RepID=A0A7W9GUH7_9ACTN|nr:hypothetical protein [Jiangella mangrovi]MBB5790279.1 ATP/maltotriose-dependent transcriptional regulator MalT [Jiangella mangrovi]
MDPGLTGTAHLDFLRRICVAPEVSAAFAAQLAGVADDDALAHLGRAERDGLGEWLAGGDAGVPALFRLAPAVRAALRDDLHRSSPALADDLRRQYADWCLRNDDPFAATVEAIQLGDLSLATRALRTSFLSICRQHGEAMISLLSAVPPANLRRHPFLVACLAGLLDAGEGTRTRGRDLFAQAYNGSKRRGGRYDETTTLVMGVVEAASARMIGRRSAATAALGRAMDAYGRLSAAQRHDLRRELPSLLVVIGHTHEQLGQFRQAVTAYRAAHASARVHPADELLTAPLLAGVHAVGGTMTLADELIARARDLGWPARRHGGAGVLDRLAEAIAALERFDLLAAERCVDAAERSVAGNECRASLAPVRAFVDAARGRPLEGLARLRGSRASRGAIERSPAAEALLDTSQALLHLAAGEVADAEVLLTRCPAHLPGVAVVRSLVALCTGAPAGAAVGTEGMRPAPLDPRTESILLLVHAAAAVRSGDDGPALTSIAAAAALMTANGLHTPLAFLPAGDLGALVRLAEAARDDAAVAVLTARSAGRPVPSLFPSS